MNRLVLCGLAAAAALGGWSCRKAAPPPAPAVATFAGGSVSAEDIDRAILDAPSHLRQPADGDLLSWYERIARDLAVQQLLLAEARAAGLDRGPEFAAARAEAVKQAAVAEFLEKELPRAEAPREAEVKAYYEAHRDEYRSPATRETFHLFRRIPAGGDAARVAADVARLRARVLAGEDFRELAAAESESESRHRKGLLGRVRRGQLNAELERVIFSLAPGVPSEPLPTREGVHLFYVSSEAPERNYGYGEVRASIALRLATERREEEIRKRVGPPPPGSLVPDAEAWRQIVEAGDPQAVVLRVGDVSLTLGDFQQRLVALQSAMDLPIAAAPQILLQTLTQRELMYRYCQEKGIDRSPGAQARLTGLLERELAGQRLRRRMLERADSRPERLRDYYESNRARFSEPLLLHVQRLRVPLSSGGNAAMARLEQALPGLDRGRLALASLATELGGSVEDLGWQTLGQLAAAVPRGVAAASALGAGRHTPPYRSGDHIEMVAVRERREPVPLPYEKVRERVRTDYVFTHRHQEYTDLVAEMLAQSRFQVARDRLEEMLRRQPGTS